MGARIRNASTSGMAAGLTDRAVVTLGAIELRELSL
jgi:hypothetical protein